MKEVFVLMLVFLSLFSIGLISAAGESCSVTDRASCESSGYVVMGLSSATNAHGELANQSNYNEVLCCNFAASTTCDSQNKILGLSSATNAHAEIPTLNNYAFDVCYGNLRCISTSDTCGSASASSYPISTVSLAGSTNSHLGEVGDYPTNICCKIGGGTNGTQTVYWANSQGASISTINATVGATTVRLTIENSGLANGTSVDFDIYENDLLFDDFIRTVTGTTDSNGKVVAQWTITQADLDKTSGDYSEFYFNANGDTSAYLSINPIEGFTCNQVVTCLDYPSQDLCTDDGDLCQVASNSVPDDVNCDDPLVDCYCSWNSTASLCNPAYDLSEEDNSSNESQQISLVGTCTYNSQTGDNCDDGFLTYS